MLFEYPKQAFFGRKLPKTKIYEHARISARLRKKIIDEIERITWAYKLSPETIKLKATETVPEIEIFVIETKSGELSADVIRCIDNAIPFPIFYEIVADGRTKVIAAYKRPSEGDSSKWVTDIYFESKWHREHVKRQSLPVALDLGKLYEQMLAALMPAQKRDGETLRETTERIAQIRLLEHEAAKLESRMRKEKQFNRRVELNSSLRNLRQRIKELTQ